MIRPQPKPPKVVQDEARLDFVRTMPCLVEFGTHDGNVQEHLIAIAFNGDPHECEAHHVRKGTLAGVGRKPPANRTVPLCRAAHEEYHRIGHDSFCAKYGLDLEAHLRRINAEFEKLHIKPKRERKKRMKAVLHVTNCKACGHAHEIPMNKFTIDWSYQHAEFRCINTNQVIEVQ